MDGSPNRDSAYQALVSGAALWANPGRSVVEIGGARAARMLGGLLSAEVEALSEGESVLSFVLTSKGRPVAVPLVVRAKDAFLLDVASAALPGLLDHFRTYLPPRFASVRVLEEAAHLSLFGPRAREVSGAIDSAGALAKVARTPADGGGFDAFFETGGAVAEAYLSSALEAGAILVGPADFDVWRIEQGLPEFGKDITAENLPQETGLVPRAVSFDKGCYTGQEVVARIHYRGHVNRHLRGLRSADPRSSRVLAVGSELFHSGRVVATVTSACESPRFGPIALAYVRREVPPGESLSSEPEAAPTWLVTETPFTLE